MDARSFRIFVTVLTVSGFTALAVGIITTVSVLPISSAQEVYEAWKWDCISGRCEKVLLTPDSFETAMSLGACKMMCNDYGNMWPKPTSTFRIGDSLKHVNISNIDISTSPENGPAINLLRSAIKRFQKNVDGILPANFNNKEGGSRMTIRITISDSFSIALNLNTDEGYQLELETTSDGIINARIESVNFFGARNALETLGQFFIYDEIRSQIQTITSLFIVDKPVYPYRGLLLDTARNFYSVESIKRTIDGMGASKLNTFHWHITDSHSFSYASKSNPEFTRLGAISSTKVYTAEQIVDIVQYGIERGVRVMPEFDAPAHVGEGWQGTNLTVCFKAEPWQTYCVEPPCGQLDPTKDHLYDVIEGIYSDMFELFKPDIFHMGGDEVHNSCWNSSLEITTWMQEKGWDTDEVGFLKLWDYFQKKAQEKVYKVNGGKKIPLILWTSTLTEFKHIEEYLSNDDYIIQVWTTGEDKEIKGLLEKGYKLIMSNYDALYFDCGFGAWVGEGNNWCSPYIGWQKVYQNSPALMAGEHKNLIIGSEAALWSEQSDTTTLDGRFWPRAGALAERLWAEPETNWTSAEWRFLHYRERLVRLGIAADSIQPEWCYQNEGFCYL